MQKESKAAELRAINADLNALNWSRSDDDPPRDLLVESGQILRHETRKLATSAHLDAVVQLVKDVRRILDGGTFDELGDWLKASEKVL